MRPRLIDKLTQLWRRLLFYWRREAFDRELAEEMRFHLEMKIEENSKAGMTPKEARYAAQRKFGNQTLLKEVSREMWGFNSLETLLQDVRYSLRMMRCNPGFTAVTVLSLALGIGANTAIFSVVNAVLLRPLPYQDPDRLAILWTANTRQRLPDGTSYPNFKDWRDQNHVFADLAVFHRPQFTSVILTGADGPERIGAGVVSANFFSVLGVPPALGRTFSFDEELRHDPVVVLSYGLWQRWFGASPDVVGQTLEVFYPRERNESNSRKRLQVIGVMPAPFHFPNQEIQLWVPHDRHQQVRDADSFVVLGRLQPKATFREAQAEMNTIASRLEQQYPDSNASLGVNVVPLLVEINGNHTQLALWVLLGAVVFVLLIACTNVANLFLARGAAREREFAVRAALGAGRARLIRQLLTESAALSLAAGLLSSRKEGDEGGSDSGVAARVKWLLGVRRGRAGERPCSPEEPHQRF